MTIPSNPQRLSSFQLVALLAGAITALIGVLGALGWALSLRVLTSIVPTYIPIALSTCLAFLIQGVVLILHARYPSVARRAPFAALVAVSAIFGFLAFIGYFAGLDLNFERALLFSGERLAQFPVNLMSPLTGVLFTLSGLSLLLLLRNGGGKPVAHLAGGLAIPTAMIGLIATVGYVYGAPLLYAGSVIPMALTTSAAFMFLGAGLAAAAGPGVFFLAPLTGGSIRAMLLRTFVPLGFIAVIGADIFQHVVMDSKSALGSAVTAVFCGMVMVALVVQAARRIGGIVEKAEAERMQAEEELRRYALLAGHSRDIILFMRRDDGRILEANAAADAYGYSHEELLNLTIQDLRAAETRTLTVEQMEEADTRGILFETVHRRKDGSAFPVEVSSRGMTLQGKRTLVSVVRDITERKRAREVRNRLAAIVEGSEDAIISKTLDGTITSWNGGSEIVYGYSAEEAVGRPINLLIPPDRGDEMRDVLEKIARGERIVQYETERLRRDGRRISVSLSVSPIRDASGEIVGVSTIARDISEKKRAEEEREELLRELRETLARLRTLSGLLPICAHCKKIRNDEGYWQQIESYIQQHSGTQFSHGICPECLKKHYSEFLGSRLDDL
ncbi:MAG: PAS domain S-box protein [Syntrophobacteraceae bacterium]